MSNVRMKSGSIFQSYNLWDKQRQRYVGHWDLSLCNQRPSEPNRLKFIWGDKHVLIP